jgi:hypothetical protein
MMSPKAVLLDFEKALAVAFTNVFPTVSVQCDLFHLVQANVKQAGQLEFKVHAKEIVIDVNVLWFASTKQDREVAQFFDKWDKKKPSYSAYFCTNWLNCFPTETWALFGRPNDALSGLWFVILLFVVFILVLFLTFM